MTIAIDEIIFVVKQGFVNEPQGLYDYTPFPNALFNIVHPVTHKPLTYYLSPAEQKLLDLVIHISYETDGKTSLSEMARYTGLSSKGIRLVREVLKETGLISVSLVGMTNQWSFHLENLGQALEYYYNKELDKKRKKSENTDTFHLEICRLVAIGCKLWYVKSDILAEDVGTPREGTFSAKVGEIVTTAKELRKLAVTLDELEQMTVWFSTHWKNNGVSALSPADYLSYLLLFREYQQKIADDTNRAYRESLIKLYDYKGVITGDYEKHITHIASKLIEAKKPLEWVRNFKAIFYSHYPSNFKLPNSKALIEKYLHLEMAFSKPTVTTMQQSPLAARLAEETHRLRTEFRNK